jgi:membrane-bound metal-dependent hydrolase YbcI (DUF457 family)
MYAGHFAAAYAIKAREPKAPTWALLLGAAALDLLFSQFIMTGIEKVTMTPSVAPGMRWDDIGWSHSLVMSIIWSVLFSVPFFRYGRSVMIAIGVAVFSHFLLDVPMHPGDLTLWPGSGIFFGLGFLKTFPHGYWFIEFAVMLIFWTYYWRRTKADPIIGSRPITVGIVLILLHLLTCPWLAPV